MNTPRALAIVVVAGGGAVALNVGLAGAGMAPFFPAAAVCACVALAGTWLGARLGGVTGLLAGAALVYVRSQAGFELGAADLIPVLVLASIGGTVGLTTDRLRRLLSQSVATEIEARRETYLLKRELETLAPPAAKAPAAAARAATRRRAAPPEPAKENAVVDLDARLAVALGSIASALNESRLLATVLEAATELVGATRVTLHLHDRRADRFADGTCHPAGEPVPVFDREPLLRAALRRRELLARDEHPDEFRLTDEAVRFVVPVFDRVILIGFFVVEGQSSLPGAQARLAILTTAFGLALSSVRLVTQLELRDRTDMLTGLPSVNEIRDTLARSLERGRTGALLVAADGIRDVNEAYGRKAGDKAVQALSKLLALEVGAEGMVGRYGGATMLVVLPGTELESAVELAERVLRRVPTSIPAGPEGLAKPLTASVGAAAATVGPVDALLGQAETALKAAQDAGGGRCSTTGQEGAIHA